MIIKNKEIAEMVAGQMEEDITLGNIAMNFGQKIKNNAGSEVALHTAIHLSSMLDDYLRRRGYE